MLVALSSESYVPGMGRLEFKGNAGNMTIS